MKLIGMYEAEDGKRFFSEKDCAAYEARPSVERLVGLTIEQIRAAIARNDRQLGDAIEDVGDMIREARLAAGDKRKRKKKGDTQ